MRSAFTVVGDRDASLLTRQWADALCDMVLRHPDRRSAVELELNAGPQPRLCFKLDVGHDTTSGAAFEPFVVSTVNLSYWPGVTLARAWVAAGWAGYLLHESLELVTVGDLVTRPIDPHGDESHDRRLRDGLPSVLTPESLERALTVVMSGAAARAFVQAHAEAG